MVERGEDLGMTRMCKNWNFQNFCCCDYMNLLGFHETFIINVPQYYLEMMNVLTILATINTFYVSFLVKFLCKVRAWLSQALPNQICKCSLTFDLSLLYIFEN